ncbi:Hsp70 family protein [Dermatobacter hominis]|uniref:Hsp70 family protein n=1 Tax=Dermatobacter hominis TaxID=2884263 RepID=UPI001D10DEDD|nr:Hsp70 family protein [Dermatobacter hominis]UDY35009.1 Hsp70 family protein [Dermatobacter hominis]
MTTGPSTDGSGWALAIDFGTTTTAAAIVRGADVALVRFSSTTRMPSGVFVDPDRGLLAATAAVNRGGADPGRYVRTPKRHVGRDEELVVGGDSVSVTELVAKVLATVVAEATSQAGGTPPDHVVLTHPARWGSPARQVLLDAAAEIGIEPGAVTLVPEPVAAGHDAASGGRGSHVAIYDLGGGTFDAVVLSCGEDGSWSMAGRPGGIDPFGGESIDAALHRHLIAQVMDLDPAAGQAIDTPATAAERGLARTWWRDLRALKEDLSESSSCSIAVPGTGHSLLVTREELESLIEAPLARSVDEFERTVRSADIEPDQLTEVLLCGDASRMPIVARMVADRFDRVTVRSADDPKGVVARGAVPAAATEADPLPEPVPEGADPVPAETAEFTAASAPIEVVGGAGTGSSPAWVIDPDPTAPVAPVAPTPVAPPVVAPAVVAPALQPGGDHRVAPPAAGIPIIGPDGTVLDVVASGGTVAPAGPVPSSEAGAPLGPATGPVVPAGSGDGGGGGSTGKGKVLALVAVILVVLVGAGIGIAVLSSTGGDDTGDGGGGGDPGGQDLALLKAHFGLTTSDDCTFTESPPTAKCGDAGPIEMPGVQVSAAFGKHASTTDLDRDLDRYRRSIPSDATVFADDPYISDGNAVSSTTAGTLLAFQDSDEDGDVVYRMVATEEGSGYIVEVISPDYDAAEWTLIDAVGGASLRDAEEAFGSTFGLDEFIGCWPNISMLLEDGAVTSYDCWSTSMGEGSPEIQAEFREVADAGGADAVLGAIAEANPGDVVVESGQWNSGGVPQGSFYSVTRSEDTRYPAHIYWTNSAEPALLGHLIGTDTATLTDFWSAAALP